jgi:hypothetical protein
MFYMKPQRKIKLPKKIAVRLSVIALAFVVLLGTGLFVLRSMPDTVSAAVPGTAAYYEERIADAKISLDWKSVGRTYNTAAGSGTTTQEGPWQLNLSTATCSAPWNGAATTPTTGAGTLGNPYQVTTAEQYRFCVANRKSFVLQKDIDLAGYLGRNWETLTNTINTDWVADGNGHTVYNYYHLVVDAQTSMFGRSGQVIIQNLRISNAYSYDNTPPVSTVNQAIFVAGSRSSPVTIRNCAAENIFSLVNNGSWGAAIFTADTKSIIDNSYTRNCHVAVISGTGASFSCSAQISVLDWGPKITNTFAIEGSIIGTAGHNGGLMSCAYDDALVKNCFSNINVYGNRQAGNFIGVLHPQNESDQVHQISDSFSSGKVEGTQLLGGFVGIEAPENTTLRCNTNIEYCYTTALVGNMKGTSITGQGGFIGGGQQKSSGAAMVISNSYAAGEVGPLSMKPGEIANYSGGFVGDDRRLQSLTVTNCFYDKQTTAMREVAAGGGKSYPGAVGVLTSDTVKAGKGLAGGTPGSTGFTGFADNSRWVYTEGHYPQLKVFVQPTTFTNTNWISQTNLNNLIKAYSAASTSTVQLETYERNWDSSVTLPATVYDTVRDLTRDFKLTSTSNVNWSLVGNGQTLSNGTGNALNVMGETLPLIQLTKQAGQWIGHSPAPGVEWLRVTNTIDGQIGTRALRITPTAYLRAGNNTTLQVGDTYDHADGVRLLYTTAARLSVDETDITKGIFPDRAPPALTENQLLWQPGTPANFAAADDRYTDVNMNHMLNSSSLEVLIKNSAGVELPLRAGPADPTLQSRWNGKTPMTEADVGTYGAKYVWILPDQRYLNNFIEQRLRVRLGMLVNTAVLTAENSTVPSNDTEHKIPEDIKNTLHIRQIVINPLDGLWVPNIGYYQNSNNGAPLPVTSHSGKFTDLPFTEYYLPLSGDKKLTIKAIIPQYYNYAGHYATMTAHNTGTPVSPLTVPNGSIQLDYSENDEWYITVYITPKGGDSPHMDTYAANHFGNLPAAGPG